MLFDHVSYPIPWLGWIGLKNVRCFEFKYPAFKYFNELSPLLKVLVLCKTINKIKRDLSIVVVKAQFSPTLVNKIKLAPINFSSPVYYPVLACVWKPSWHTNLLGYSIESLLRQNEGNISGCPIQQYRNKNWQIPKYRVENRRNADTTFMIGHA